MTPALAVALALAGQGAAAGPSTPSPTSAAAHATGSQACELRLSEHRSGRELMRLPLNPQAPEVRIAFEHSVLGTTVIDRYRFTPAPLLVEEEFEVEGYGLPAAAGPGERLEQVGMRKRLTLARTVDPLVVRALAEPRMRLLLPQGELLLARLGAAAVALEAVGCTTPPR